MKMDLDDLQLLVKDLVPDRRKYAIQEAPRDWKKQHMILDLVENSTMLKQLYSQSGGMSIRAFSR